MARKWAIVWHALFSIGAGVLYFYFVLPRWPELMGDTSHALGTALRIVTGALIGLAALPVVFVQLRSRRPELGTPQLALSIRTWSIVAHVLAGVLIIGTAISEIWLSLDTAGQYLFGTYGAAAAIAVLGFFAFYLSFIAELPPPPPKPIKAKKPKRRRLRRGKKGDGAEEALEEATEEATEEEATEESEEAEEPELEDAEETEATEAETVEAQVPDAQEAGVPEQADEVAPEPEPATGEVSATNGTEKTPVGAEPQRGLQNRRPAGKASHRMRRRRTRGGVALDE